MNFVAILTIIRYLFIIFKKIMIKDQVHNSFEII